MNIRNLLVAVGYLVLVMLAAWCFFEEGWHFMKVLTGTDK